MAKGNSGVRLELLQQLAAMISQNVLPLIPQEGSVGASGDLSLLSYIGATISGFRDVKYNGTTMKADVALAKANFLELFFLRYIQC